MNRTALIQVIKIPDNFFINKSILTKQYCMLFFFGCYRFNKRPHSGKMITILFFTFSFSEVRSTVSVYYDATSKSYTHVSGKYDSFAAARAILIDNHEKNGWYDLHVEANEGNDDEVQAYASGYAEGFITQPLFKPHMKNVY